MFKCKVSNRINGDNIKWNFGVFDAKGREVGASVQLFEVDIDPLSDDEAKAQGWHESKMLGHVYGYCPHALRGGKCFGAIQSDYYFRTEKERAKAVQRYLVGAQKRAMQNFSDVA